MTPDGKYLYVNYQCLGPGGATGTDAIGKFDGATGAFLRGITGFPNVGAKITVTPDSRFIWGVGFECLLRLQL